jgi:hypothetical protein
MADGKSFVWENLSHQPNDWLYYHNTHLLREASNRTAVRQQFAARDEQ